MVGDYYQWIVETVELVDGEEHVVSVLPYDCIGSIPALESDEVLCLVRDRGCDSGVGERAWAYCRGEMRPGFRDASGRLAGRVPRVFREQYRAWLRAHAS